MIFQYSDSASFLKDVLGQRAAIDGKYSLRAFATDLGISAAGLSQILNRKKRLSNRRAFDFGSKLGLTDGEKEYLSLLVQFEAAQAIDQKAALAEKMERQRPAQARDLKFLDVERFRIVSDWYGLAILELVAELPGPHGKDTIAKKFGISIPEVDSTLERLVRLGLLERDGKRFSRTKMRFRIESPEPAKAVRYYYSSVLEKLEPAIQRQTPSEKSIGAEVFAFDPSDLPEIVKATDDYLDRLNDIAGRGKNRTEIYQALACVFRLTEGAPQNQEKK